MKRIGNIGFWWVILWWAGIPLQHSTAQTNPANIWATVQFSKQQVVAGEPLVVTFTVYTSTWFTSPPQFDEIQVPEAIMVEYEQRSGALRRTVGKKSYPV